MQDPDFDNNELKSDAVEHLSLDTTKSFDIFKNKYLDSSNIDFSDRIQRSHKGGYQAKSVYEIIGEQVAKETPQQKYQRLQLELQELAEEVIITNKNWSIFWPQILFLSPPPRSRIPVFFPNFSHAQVGMGRIFGKDF